MVDGRTYFDGDNWKTIWQKCGVGSSHRKLDRQGRCQQGPASGGLQRRRGCNGQRRLTAMGNTILTTYKPYSDTIFCKGVDYHALLIIGGSEECTEVVRRRRFRANWEVAHEVTFPLRDIPNGDRHSYLNSLLHGFARSDWRGDRWEEWDQPKNYGASTGTNNDGYSYAASLHVHDGGGKWCHEYVRVNHNGMDNSKTIHTASIAHDSLRGVDRNEYVKVLLAKVVEADRGRPQPGPEEANRDRYSERVNTRKIKW